MEGGEKRSQMRESAREGEDAERNETALASGLLEVFPELFDAIGTALGEVGEGG
jgi:hypothetical protein